MAITTYTDFVNNYLTKNGMIGNAANINKAPDQLKLEVDELNQGISTLGNTAVKLTGDQTIAGVKTFSSNIVGNVTGNITGNSATTTKLQTARTIGGVSFDGTSNINLPGVNAAGNQNTTGNAATATKLATARTIALSGDVNGSVSFDGSTNVSITAAVTDDSHNHIISNVDGLQVALDSKADTSYVNNKYSGFKNYIINGGFDIDQRNNKVGILIPASGYAFSADRWLINNVTNQPVSITVAEFPTPSGGRVGRLRIKFDTAPTSGFIQVSQKIENVVILGGKQVTLSHSFDCDAMTITNDATQNFGSGGSSNVLTSFSNINTTGVTNSLTRFSSSITLPSVYGKTIGAGSYTQITYKLPIRTTNIQTIAQVQLEEGSVATPFENRPYGLELSLCQRYYQQFIVDGALGELYSHERVLVTSPGISYVTKTIPFKVTMRTTPSVTIPRVFHGETDYATGWSVYLSGLNNGNCGIAIYKNTSVTANQIIAFDATAFAEL